MHKQLDAVFGQHMPELQSIGMMQFDPVWAESMHPAGRNELMHVVRGQVTLEIDNNAFTADPGETLLIPAESMHCDRFDLEQGLEVFHCSFGWEASDAFFKIVSNQNLLQMSPTEKSTVRTLIDQMRADVRNNTEVDRIVAQARMHTMLLIMLRSALRQQNPSPEEDNVSYGQSRRLQLMREAKVYMQKHYDKCITLDEISEHLHVSSYYLSHIFSEESDFSLFTYLTVLRMEKAKAHLCEGRLNVSEVARAVGYENANYFSKVFKKQCGLSPRDYAASKSATKHPK